ncbi:MAG: NUDIX hydrolase [Cyanosarcina radialis HA8281-LM2]|jgi:8-oxo-dGTP pyrophosphatase MutT (NUDIX family)|nr:NUDIX hydrolase [Cyanosarcina radialis HA8281-LM2]
MEKWKIQRSQFVINNKWCQVRQDKIELPTGEIIDDFFVNVRDDIALVFPLTPQQEIVFVRQYRHAVGEILLELPAGAFNAKEEDSAIAAARELEEETGYVAQQLIKLATLYDNPVKDTNQIHLFLAEGVQPASQQMLDLTEDIEVVLIPISEAIARVASGEIAVSGTVAAIFLGLNFLGQRSST